MKRLEIRTDWNLNELGSDPADHGPTSANGGALDSHQAPPEVPRRTIIFCNTVSKALDLYDRLKAQKSDNLDLLLLHSRFRPPDREERVEALRHLQQFKQGQIVVSTQVLEAGVDISSGILWTEPAGLPSIVQRLGRLNRAGEFCSNGSAVAGGLASSGHAARSSG